MAVLIKKIKNGIESSVYDGLKEVNYKPSHDSAFIKPNIVTVSRPSDAFITNPRVVGGIIDYLKDAGVKKIVVAEGPVDSNVNKVFAVSGYAKLCKHRGVRLLNLEEGSRRRISCASGTIELPEAVFDSEYINVSKLKTHMQALVSLGLKNQKGLLSSSTKRAFHCKLHESIANLAKAFSPSLSIIDATNAVEGNGPGRMGRVVKDLSLLVMGREFLFTDSVGSRIMGIDPYTVKHLSLAQEYGAGSFEGEILGVPLESVQRKFLLPSNYHRKFNTYLWWDERTCSGCTVLMGEIKNCLMKNPLSLMKVICGGIMRRLDFITGGIKEIPKGSGRVICLGKCTESFSIRNGFTWIKGCPPDPKEVVGKL